MSTGRMNCRLPWIECWPIREIGIVLLTEKFGRDFPEVVNRLKLDYKVPLFVEIPDRHGTGRKPNFITTM